MMKFIDDSWTSVIYAALLQMTRMD